MLSSGSESSKACLRTFFTLLLLKMVSVSHQYLLPTSSSFTLFLSESQGMFNVGQICHNFRSKHLKASLISSTRALFSDKARYFSQSERVGQLSRIFPTLRVLRSGSVNKEKVLYCFYKIILKNTPKSETSQNLTIVFTCSRPNAPIDHYSSPLNFPLSSLVKTDHAVRSRASTICH